MKKTEGYKKFQEIQINIDVDESYPDPNEKLYTFRDMKCAIESNDTEWRVLIGCILIALFVIMIGSTFFK